MRTENRDMSPEAIRARYRACFEPKPEREPAVPAKVVLPVAVSAAAAERAKANPQGAKFVTRDSAGVTHIEGPIVIEATTRELEARGLALAPRAYYERLDEGLCYRPDKGSVMHSYDPRAGLGNGGDA